MPEFKELNLSSLRPGVFLELNTRSGVTGLPANAQFLWLIAQKTADGNLAPLTPTQMFSTDEVAIAAGYGSTAQGMAISALLANRTLNFGVVLLDDAPASAARVLTITITITALAPGIAVLSINNYDVQVSVATDDTPTDIAAALAARALDFPFLPYDLVAVAGVITATAKNTGTTNNQDTIAFAATPATGVLGAVLETVPGSTDPDIQTALTALFPAGGTLIASPYNATLDAQALRDHCDDVSNGLEMRGCRGIIATTDNVANSTTLAGQINGGRIGLPNYNGQRSAGYEIAAAAASVEAGFEDPALPRRNMLLPGIAIAPLDQRFSKTQEEAMLSAGVSPLNVGPGEIAQIVRFMSTKTLNAQGVSDPSLIDFNTIAVLDFGRKAIRDRWDRDFSDAKATERTREAVESALLDVLYKLEAAEIWENIDDNRAGISVIRDPDQPTRFLAEIPADVVNGLHQIFGVIRLIL